MVTDHIDMRTYFIKEGEPTDGEGLFGNPIWKASTDLEHEFVLERTLQHLIEFEEVDFIYAGVNDEGKNLYKRIV